MKEDLLCFACRKTYQFFKEIVCKEKNNKTHPALFIIGHDASVTSYARKCLSDRLFAITRRQQRLEFCIIRDTAPRALIKITKFSLDHNLSPIFHRLYHFNEGSVKNEENIQI